MIAFPNAKINLGLRVYGKRDDGYHNIETIMVPVDYCDILEIVVSPDGEPLYTFTGIVLPGKSPDNLVVRAYSRLQKQFGLPPVHLHLHKAIPFQAGLGGGSSDAAFTIMMLNKLFKLDLNTEEMQAHASVLGSDCPFFIRNQASLATGRGEIINPLSLSLAGLTILIVKPPVEVSTAEAYANIDYSSGRNALADYLNTPVEKWRDHFVNDFEHFVFSRFPEVAAIKEKMYASGALFAQMSGSGSAVYGIFEEGKIPENEFPGFISKRCRAI
ncbi:MAG: 4-(cytidine 5'-diphospho)-2-C-methyl-D-erythritol kinase [Bacteroidetes bacterium]|nr:4-(cytidine 5'-diphospho)-2-C-methyl-D-erythritol kinase [Bacteroidota bacterium]